MESLKNKMKMEFQAAASNEGFARVAVGAFVAALNPTVDELADIKTAVSEAVTNCIIHGYEQKEEISGFSVPLRESRWKFPLRIPEKESGM